MGAYTNLTNIPLSVAVWLTNDNYDHDSRDNHISATSLLKSTRQIVLSLRVPAADKVPDVAELVPSRMGSAIHDGIERAWIDNYKTCLNHLGYPQRVIDRIRVNPEPAERNNPDIIPVYLEQRSEKEVNGFIVSGKFDFVAEGGVQDFKSTSTYTYQYKTKDDDYIMQGSIYRWLNPDIITDDNITIQFLFKDWNAGKARIEKDKNYPQSSILSYTLPLKPINEIDHWVRNKVDDIRKFISAPDEAIPECTDKELWRTEASFKYYKNPEKRSRSTKNFDSYQEAQKRYLDDGAVGIVVEVPGEVKACRFCDAFSVCKQKDKYLASGELKLS